MCPDSKEFSVSRKGGVPDVTKRELDFGGRKAEKGTYRPRNGRNVESSYSGKVSSEGTGEINYT